MRTDQGSAQALRTKRLLHEMTNCSRLLVENLRMSHFPGTV